MKFIDLKKEDLNYINKTAELLFDSFKGLTDAWETYESALEEVYESMEDGKISRIAVDGNDVIGWIGGMSIYSGNVWELHPLVVKKDHRNRGIGRKLIEDLESLVNVRGGSTIFVGTDDEYGGTSLSDTDLYENLFEKIENIENYKNHPYEFYQKMGFKIIGVMPDANGKGKPDIYMAKRVI